MERELEKSNEPYFGWCDVEGCQNESCSGGCFWEETGYWKICSQHAQECREGKAQPKMKQSAIDRENSRDKITYPEEEQTFNKKEFAWEWFKKAIEGHVLGYTTNEIDRDIFEQDWKEQE